MGTKKIAAATNARAEVTSQPIIIKPFLYEERSFLSDAQSKYLLATLNQLLQHL